MAVIDVRSGSPTFGHVLKTVPVGSRAYEPHHIDFALRGDGTLGLRCSDRADFYLRLSSTFRILPTSSC